MTADDAFDAKLRAAFAAAEPEPEEEFIQRVTARLGQPGRRRMLIIGGAGAGGSTIASTQLEDLYSQVTSAAGGSLGDASVVLALLRPETLAAVTLALMVTALAFFLPSSRS